MFLGHVLVGIHLRWIVVVLCSSVNIRDRKCTREHDVLLQNKGMGTKAHPSLDCNVVGNVVFD